MFQKILFFSLLLACFVFSAKATHIATVFCPTVEDIKQNKLDDWLPLYKEGEELASAEDVAKFKTHLARFEIARWADWYLENGHCFYQGTDPIVERIVLAQDAWRPETNSHWIWVKPNKLAECRLPITSQCKFIK